MAEIFKEELGDQLYLREKGDTSILPSPASLSFKFMLKGKVLRFDSTDEEVSADEEDDSDEMKKLQRESSAALNGHIGSSNSASDAKMSEKRSPKRVRKSKLKLAPELSDIISIPSVKLHNPTDDLVNHAKSGMPSVPESSKFGTECPQAFSTYLRTHLIKIYPSGLRTDSTNLHPMEFWALGAQCISLNVQSSDLPVDLTDGLFQMNGNCGYVLKPDYLLSSKEHQYKRSITQVISGQCLPKPDTSTDRGVIDPYVSVELFVPPQCEKFDDRAKTTSVKNNGFNPIWLVGG